MCCASSARRREILAGFSNGNLEWSAIQFSLKRSVNFSSTDVYDYAIARDRRGKCIGTFIGGPPYFWIPSLMRPRIDVCVCVILIYFVSCPSAGSRGTLSSVKRRKMSSVSSFVDLGDGLTLYVLRWDPSKIYLREHYDKKNSLSFLSPRKAERENFRKKILVRIRNFEAFDASNAR